MFIQDFLSSNWSHWSSVAEVLIFICVVIMKSFTDVINLFVRALVFDWSFLFLGSPEAGLFADQFVDLIF